MSYSIRVDSVVNERGEPKVRVHIIDPDGQDGRWIDLSPHDALRHGASVVTHADKLLRLMQAATKQADTPLGRGGGAADTPVDLSTGAAGIVSFEGGPTFYTLEVCKHGDDEYLIRWESGWHKRYRRNGECIQSGVTVNQNGVAAPTPGANCVSFIPCAIDDPRARHLPTEATP